MNETQSPLKAMLVWSGGTHLAWHPFFESVSKHIQLRVLTPKNWVHGSVVFTARQNDKSASFELKKINFLSLGAGRILIPGMLFQLVTFQPHIIYVMEDPDRLTLALQIVLVKLLRPRTKIVLYALQNILQPSYYHWPQLLSHFICKYFCTGIIAATSESASVLKARGYRQTIHEIPLFAAKEYFYPAASGQKRALREQWKIRSEDLLMVYAGSLHPAKGISKLAEALHQFPNIHLFLASEHPWPEDMRHSSRIRHLGPLQGQTLRHLYQAADYVVLPSLITPNWKEQMGRILLEGILCGAVGLASKNGPMPEIVDESRALFESGDENSLLELLKNLPWHDHHLVQAKQRKRVLDNYEAEPVGLKTAMALKEWCQG